MSDQHTAEQELLRHEFPVLDTLRAVGAVAVFTTHAAFWAGAYTRDGVWGTLLARLDVGVALFFVLSGFLLARPFLARALLRQGPPPVGRYFLKRALRILPLYVVTVVLALGLITGNDDRGPRDWLVTLVLGNTFVDPTLPNGLTHMWSLAVEVSFYVLLPLLMLVAVGRRGHLDPRRVTAVVVAMVAVSVWWILAGAPRAGALTHAQPGQWLPAYLGWFGVGLFLALVELMHRRGLWTPLTSRLVALAHQPGACWTIIAGLLLVAATPLAGPSMLAAPTPGQVLTKNLLYAAVGSLAVLTGVFAEEGGRYRRVLSHRAARHLGFVSFGFFCLHLPVLHLVMWVTGWQLFDGRFVAIWLVGALTSLVAAELSYRLVELPALRLRGDGPRHRAERSPASASPTTTGTSTR
ncbi:MAG: Acyltransferase family protein [Marmoricola sp.]|nr:Acyltransferase family protein [Marmoricola sp.]